MKSSIRAPSQRSMRHFLPLYAQSSSIAQLAMRTPASTRLIPWNDRGVITEEHPRISNMLKTFEPSIFPRASWSLCLAAATMQVASSGSDVPPARMVIAMNLSLTPSLLARAVAESTKSSPPKMSPARPAATASMASGSFIRFCSGISVFSFGSNLKQKYIYAANSRRKPMPSSLDSESALPMPSRVLFIPKSTSMTEAARVSGMSLLRFSSVIDTGISSAVMPRMKRTLNMLEPITLPMDISALPCMAPVRLTTSSGQDVPKPTIVRPMTNSLTPAFLAIAEAPSTSQSAPRTMSPRPTSSKMIVIADTLFVDTDGVCSQGEILTLEILFKSEALSCFRLLNQQLTDGVDISFCGMYPGRELFQLRPECVEVVFVYCLSVLDDSERIFVGRLSPAAGVCGPY